MDVSESSDSILRIAARDQFAAAVAVPDARLDLGAAALWLAAEEYPRLDPHAYLGRLESLAERVRAACGGRRGSAAALRALRSVLVEEEGFGGNVEDYYDPRNSFLNEVLDRRSGIPITLSIIYLEVAKRAEIPLEGVNLPGHFLVRLVAQDRSVLLDPYEGGCEISLDDCADRLRAFQGDDAQLAAEHLVAAGRKQILVRMLNNLRLIYVDRKEYARALAAVDRILLITGETADLRRARGLLFAKLQLFGKAWADLAASLEASLAGSDVPVTDPDLLRRQLDRVRRLAAAPN